jgi:CRISPR-associated protein Cas1
MSRDLMNTLYVMTQDSYVRLDGETLSVECGGKATSRVPLHHLGGVVLFGRAMISPAAIQRCAEDGRTVTFLDYNGRFKARVVGPVTGNILLRQAQYAAYADKEKSSLIAKCLVAGKMQNCRTNVLRASRESKSDEHKSALQAAANHLAGLIMVVQQLCDIEQIRGCEGQGAACYFGAFDRMIRVQRTDFKFEGRNRRPPRDRVNALLSFLYAMLANDCTSALEGVGLDPQLGYLHSLRSGRPALALDLMEEFRPALAEKLALSLINLKQIRPEHFEERPGHSVMLNEDGRKAVVVAYQKRKQDEVMHPLMKTAVPMGLVMHLQARLFARYLRGETDAYPPFMPR